MSRIGKLENRLEQLLASEDLAGIEALDDEVRALLSDSKSLSVSDLQALDALYTGLTKEINVLRQSLATKAKGMHANRKGIQAYKSS